MIQNKILSIILSVSTISAITFVPNIKNSCATEQCIIVPNIKLPHKNSLTGSASRNWYNKQIHNIPNLLAAQNVTSAEESAHIAYSYRNYFKKAARDSMLCSSCANFLNQNEKAYEFDELFHKYHGDYNKITQSSIKSRETVNILSKISDFFETFTPKIYEKILFPLAMYFSKLFK